MTAAKQTRIHEQNLAKAEESLDSAQRSVRKEAQVYITVPPTHLAAGTRVLHLQLPANAESRSEFIMVGPEHLRIAGKNGSGKTTLINHILGADEDDGVDYVIDSIGYLRQRIEFDPQLTVMDTVAARLPALSQQELRDQLAQLLLKTRLTNRWASSPVVNASESSLPAMHWRRRNF